MNRLKETSCQQNYRKIHALRFKKSIQLICDLIGRPIEFENTKHFRHIVKSIRPNNSHQFPHVCEHCEIGHKLFPIFSTIPITKQFKMNFLHKIYVVDTLSIRLLCNGIY